MKRILIMFMFMLVSNYLFSQGLQRFADGTSTDQNQNTFEWINYGTEDWSIENAEVTHYRDGTPIPQVTDDTEWANLTIGAWCYYNNDPSKGKLYNWYAVAGIHDNDENTPNKELAPEGWRVPSDEDWTTLGNYLIDNGYNYDGTTTGNKIAKSLSSTSGWDSSTTEGTPGNNQNENNSSGFNSHPQGSREENGILKNEGKFSVFWSSTMLDSNISHMRYLDANNVILGKIPSNKYYGYSVRFVRDLNEGDILLNGTVSLENNQIKNVADPTDAQDVITKSYFDSNTPIAPNKNIEQILSYGNDANGKQIKGLADPTDAQDAVTMSLLQSKIDQLIQRIENLESDVNNPVSKLALVFEPNSYIRIPNIDVYNNLESMTIEFWTQINSNVTTDESIIGTEYFASGWHFYPGTWAYISGSLDVIENDGAHFQGPSLTESGKLYHVALQYDNDLTENQFKLFIDGKLIEQHSGEIGLIGDGGDIVINRHIWDTGSSSRLSGKIDEVRFSNIARYNNNFTPSIRQLTNDENTLLLLHFEDGNENFITDSSDYQNHGVFVGSFPTKYEQIRD